MMGYLGFFYGINFLKIDSKGNDFSKFNKFAGGDVLLCEIDKSLILSLKSKKCFFISPSSIKTSIYYNKYITNNIKEKDKTIFF